MNKSLDINNTHKEIYHLLKFHSICISLCMLELNHILIFTTSKKFGTETKKHFNFGNQTTTEYKMQDHVSQKL